MAVIATVVYINIKMEGFLMKKPKNFSDLQKKNLLLAGSFSLFTWDGNLLREERAAS